MYRIHSLELSESREQATLEREDNGRLRNVEDKTSPGQDVLMNELQMQKTHDLYCPNCIHKVTETAKFFEKGEATFPYNKQRFLLGFVIVISFKYPFIYLPWLYNITPDGSEATQRVVDETPRKHVLDWLWLLSVVVSLLLSATVLWVLLSPTIPDPYKIQEDATEIHGHLKPHVYDVVKEDVTEIQDRGKPHVPNIVVDESPIMPSPPLLLPLPPPHTDGSLTILVPDQQKVPEDVTKIHGHLKQHDLVEDDRPIQTSPPSLPLPLPSLPPHTSGSSKFLIPDQQRIPEDVIEIYDRLKPHVTDVVAEDDTPDPPSLSSLPPPLPLPPPSPHTNINSTTLIPDQQKLQEDATMICLKPDVAEEDRSIQPSLPSSSSPIPPSPPPPHTNGRSAILIPDSPKIEDATKIHGRLKPVGDDSHIQPSSPPPLPPPSTNESLTVLVSDQKKILEDITETLNPNILDVVEEDRPISPSPPSPLPTTQPPSQTSDSLTILLPYQQKIPEYVTDFHGRLEPHVPNVVKDDRPILPSQPHTNGSLNISIPDQQKTQKDVTDIHGHLKPHVPDVVEDDRPILPSQPHTNGSLNISIPDQKKIQEEVTDIQGHLKPHVPDVVEDDRPILPSQPHTNGSLNISIPDQQIVQEDVTDIQGHLKPQVPDVVKDDRPILPSQPHTNGSSNISIPDQQKIQEDVTDIQVHPKPQVSDVVEDDRPIMLSQPHTNGSSNISIPDQQKTQEDVTDIHGHLKPHIPDVVEDGRPILPSQPHTNGSLNILIPDQEKIQEDVTDIQGHLKPHIPDVVEDGRPILPSQPHTNESLNILIPDQEKIQEDVTDIQGHLKPHVPDVVEDDRPILPSQPHTNGSSNISIPDQRKIQEDVTDIQGHLKPQVPDVVEDDRPILPSQPHTNGSLNTLIPDQQKIQEDITEIDGHLKSHVPDVVEDDIHNTSSLPPAFPPPPPSSHTNGSLTVLISGLQKISENASEIDGRLKPLVPDVVEDNRHIPSSSPPLVPTPHSNESLTISIFKTSEDVTEIQDRLKPHVPNVVEQDIPITPTPTQVKKKGGWIPLSWTLFVISLLLPVILALCLLSISWKRRTNGETQASTNKPEEDVTGVENNEDVASQNDDLSTIDRKRIGSRTHSPPTTLAKLPGILWKHIVVQVQNMLQTELDIVKSIVYGGLIESITSFGAVSAAAASGTSTHNVLALGLANLFSGLFLIIYNLHRLVMSEPFYQSANNDHMADVKATDPYEELLGSREKVILHCVVVVVSFIFFGVISPLLYGFSFKITDNGHYEAAVFVAGSLVCVISLSFAKAYAFGMDKHKTVAAYTGIAISGSALSFIASQHARDVFAKYDFHKLASDYLKG